MLRVQRVSAFFEEVGGAAPNITAVDRDAKRPQLRCTPLEGAHYARFGGCIDAGTWARASVAQVEEILTMVLCPWRRHLLAEGHAAVHHTVEVQRDDLVHRLERLIDRVGDCDPTAGVVHQDVCTAVLLHHDREELLPILPPGYVGAIRLMPLTSANSSATLFSSSPVMITLAPSAARRSAVAFPYPADPARDDDDLTFYFVAPCASSF